MSNEALELWTRRLDYLLLAEAKNVDPIQGFALKIEIEETQARIAEMRGGRPAATLASAVEERADKLEILHLIDQLLQTRGKPGNEPGTGTVSKVAAMLDMPTQAWRSLEKSEDQTALLAIFRWAVRKKKHADLLEVLRDLYNAPLNRPRVIDRDLIFLSYSHIDEAWYLRLRKLLEADPDLRGLVWAYKDIPSSTVVKDSISQHVMRTRIMIMLGSAEYFSPASGALEDEIKPALKAHATGEMQILWFPVRDFVYGSSPVGHIMAATGAGATPIESLLPADQKLALKKVHQEVRWHLGFPPAGTMSAVKTPGKKMMVALKVASRESEPRPPVDFLIISPLPEEREAITSRLLDCQQLPPSPDDIRVYYSARCEAVFPDDSHTSYSVIVAPLAGMGLTEAATAAGDAIRRWKPRYVLLVGIAGGIEKNGVGLGDILIANQIADYELAKVTPKGPKLRWKVNGVDGRLLLAAQNFTFLPDKDPIKRPRKGEPKMHFGPICTGNKVIADAGLADKFLEVWTKLIGVEMEAGGVAHAVMQAVDKPGFFMVRGASDLADAAKDSSGVTRWREYACEIAATWTIAFLKSGPVPSAAKHRR